MKSWLLPLLACPACGEGLRRHEAASDGSPQQTFLLCERCEQRYPIANGIPRFVGNDGYASSFSFEWTRFATTQLDSARGWKESEERFAQSLDFPLEELRGKVVLDAGCGMGRFAEIVAKYGGTVVGVDLSYAVDAAARNLARKDNVQFVQADLRHLPFRPGSFDLVYSLGVLHHTPDPRASFEGLLTFLKPGGKISITLYSKYNKLYVASTNLWRRLTTKLPGKLVYYFSHLAIPLYYFYRIPGLGRLGQGLWPICMHRDAEWRLLDTFDCYTPRYQGFYGHPEIYQWFRQAGLQDIAVLEPAISFIGTRPRTPSTQP